MAGSHNASTPYHHITLEGVGTVVGFYFILMKGVWRTTLYVVGSHMTVSLLHRYLPEWQVWRGESVDF